MGPAQNGTSGKFNPTEVRKCNVCNTGGQSVRPVCVNINGEDLELCPTCLLRNVHQNRCGEMKVIPHLTVVHRPGF